MTDESPATSTNKRRLRLLLEDKEFYTYEYLPSSEPIIKKILPTLEPIFVDIDTWQTYKPRKIDLKETHQYLLEAKAVSMTAEHKIEAFLDKYNDCIVDDIRDQIRHIDEKDPALLEQFPSIDSQGKKGKQKIENYFSRVDQHVMDLDKKPSEKSKTNRRRLILEKV